MLWEPATAQQDQRPGPAESKAEASAAVAVKFVLTAEAEGEERKISTKILGFICKNANLKKKKKNANLLVKKIHCYTVFGDQEKTDTNSK